MDPFLEALLPLATLDAPQLVGLAEVRLEVQRVERDFELVDVANDISITRFHLHFCTDSETLTNVT